MSALSGCNGGSESGSVNGLSNSGGILGSYLPEAHAETAPAGVVGPTCKSGDTSKVCLSLKYVAYKSPSGTPVVTQDDAIKNIKDINQVWSQCGVAFQIGSYVAADPKASGLKYNTANNAELDDIRKAYGDETNLLVATTGPWDREGTLGNTAANAWTAMPGENLYGAILEKSVGTFGNIIAHELGHYIGLDHVSDESDLMNPVIYDSSSKLTQDQCSTARSTIASDWQRMVR
jgi:hypothetical protein